MPLWYGKGAAGVLVACMTVVVRSQTLAPVRCRDGARRVFVDQAADIACTTETRGAVRCAASLVMKGGCTASYRERPFREAELPEEVMLREGMVIRTHHMHQSLYIYSVCTKYFWS